MTLTQPLFKATCLAGALLLLASGALGWLSAPLSGWLKGYALVPFRDLVPASPPFRLLSFGVATSLLGAVGIIFFQVERVRWVVGFLALVIGIGFFYHLAFLNPHWFWPLLDENQQYQRVFSFSAKYLPANQGREPVFQTNLSGDGFNARLTSSAYFLGLGWGLAMAGAATLIATTRWRRWGFGAVFGFFIVASIPFWWSDYLRERGDAALDRGRPLEAVRNYIDAGRIDSYLGLNMDYRIHLGEAYDRLGRRDEPDAHLYQADLLEREGRTPEAMFEFEKALEKSREASRRVSETGLAMLDILYGLEQFGLGDQEKSLLFFQKAIEVDSRQVQADYYSAKAYFDLGRYPEAIAANQRLLRSVGNSIVLANVHANIGDCYYRQGEYAAAKQFYSRSMELDRYLNIRALKSLVGP
ncbi:MAG: tetratricopeptide repeat protein [Nitrospirae bacterium]|nr:tetratricopeptide repeat protein [Nitrospirota bacterium]